MGRKTLRDDYFSWLYHRVQPRPRSYIKLCKQLHNKKFVWSVAKDENRCHDGIRLREIFIEENNLDESHLEVSYFLKGECTVFEMLVALADRIDVQTYDLRTHKNRTPKWFFELIQNLGLTRFTDGFDRGVDQFDPVADAEINEILEVFLGRTYDSYGRGGLFPLKKRNRKDQSRVEIWYQLMAWLDENYGF